MKNKRNYEEVKIELVLIDSADVITTSPMGSGDNIDNDGWTTIVSIDW